MKNRFTKKTICIFLSMLMVLTCFSAIPITASAEDVTAQAVIDAYNAGLANGTNFISGTDYTASNANSTNVSIVDNTRFGDVYSLCVALQGVITQLAPSYNHNSYLRPRVKAATGNNAKINALIDLLLPIPSNYNYNSYTPSNHGTWSGARDLGHPDDNCGNNQELDFNIVSTVRRSLSAAVLSTFPGSAADVTGQVALTAKVTTSAHKHHETNVTGNGLWTYYRNCSFWTYNNSVTASTGTLTNTPDLAALAGYEALTDSAAFKNGDCENEAAGIGYEAWKVNSAVVNDMTAAQADSVLAAYKAVNSAAFTAVSNVYKEYYLADNADKTNGLDIIADYDAYIADILTLYRTVTFANYDGSVLYEQQLHTGVLPVYAGEAPVKPSTVSETYTFTGWSPEISAVTGDAVYTAQFSSAAATYIVRFFSEDGTQIGEDQIIVYGEDAVSPAIAPEKAYDNDYHYTFNGWEGYTNVQDNLDITAEYTAVPHSYDITVGVVSEATCIADRTDRFSCSCGKTVELSVADTLDSSAHGELELRNAVAATNIATGYSGDLTCKLCNTVVTPGHTTYSATAQAVIDAYNAGLANGTNFTSGTDYTASNANSTNVSIVDNTRFGDVYSLCVALQGVITQLAPSYNHNSYLRPRVKAATGNNAEINVLIDLLLSNPSTNEYSTYTPSNKGTWSGSQLYSGVGDNCGRASTVNYAFSATVTRSISAAVLSSFPDSAADVTGELPLTATVTTNATRNHTTSTSSDVFYCYRSCTWYNYNRSVTATTGTLTAVPDISSITPYSALVNSDGFGNGDCVTAVEGIGYNAWLDNSDVIADMTSTQTDSVLAAYNPVNTAEFAAVDEAYINYYLADNADKTNGTANVTSYNAYIDSITEYYRNIQFVNYDGAVLQDSMVYLGTLPVYNGATPEKPESASETFTFSGWDSELAAVTEDTVYTAQFTPVTKTFTVRFFNEDSTQIGESQTIAYGGNATAPAAPVKAYDNDYHYTFNGWDGYQSIVEDTDIYGSFTAVAHTYDEYVENVIPATCATNRTDRFSCTCGKTEDREVADSFDAENHADYGKYNDTVIAATCADTGLMGTYCEGCHALLSSVEIAIDAGNHINQATGEAYGTHDNTITAATCMAAGEKGTYCDGCNALLNTSVISVNANSHINQATGEAYGTYDDTITAATCSDTGTMGTYCEGCNALLDTSVIPVNENSHINQATGEAYGTYDNTITAATCSDLGTMGTYCEACNKLLSTADIEKNPANHKDIATGEAYETYDAVITAATCQAEGVMGTYCAGCHELLSTSVIAKDEANHINQETGEAYITYDRVITAATCSDEGTMGTYCAKCYKLISTSAIEKNPENHKNIETNEVYSTYEEVITAATCMAEGTMGTYCEGCHEKLSEAVIAINADNHINQATGEAYGTYSNTITAATCSDEGTMGTYCEGCDKLLSTSVIEKDAANHKDIATGEAYATYDAVITPATCMAEGLMGTYCAGCHEKLSEAVIAINAGNHINQETGEAYATYEEVILAPTCSVSGRLGTFCSECDALISEVSIEKDMENHADYGTYRETVTAATCKNEGVMGIYCYGCGNQVGSEPIAINPNNHTGETELRDIIPATCGTKGFSGNIYCLDCGEMIVAGYVTPYNGDVHTPGEPVNERIVSATCARAGSHDEVVYCSVCNKQISRTNIIDPKTNDHRRSYPEVENIIAATCAHPGTHDEVVYCGICSIELERKTITDAATGDHVYDAGVITTPASCTADGVKTFTCTECGDTYTKSVPALGHIDENSDDVCDRCGEQLGATEPTEPTEPSNPSGVCVCGSTTIHDRSNPIEFFKCMFTYLINMFRSLFTGK